MEVDKFKNLIEMLKKSKDTDPSSVVHDSEMNPDQMGQDKLTDSSKMGGVASPEDVMAKQDDSELKDQDPESVIKESEIPSPSDPLVPPAPEQEKPAPFGMQDDSVARMAKRDEIERLRKRMQELGMSSEK